jgi:hypothetical protein
MKASGDANLKKKAPKGHRQRGAGTVIVSPPTITTDEGIKLAPHMRLPSVLLQEFCQREKYPKPIYESCSCPHGSFRMKVKIPDLKNHRKDLVFLPNVSCNSDKMARDYAALLALYHFQPTLPLERKFPEPYRTTWLDMISRRSNQVPTDSAIQEGVEPDNSPLPLLDLKNQYEYSSIADEEQYQRKRRSEDDRSIDKISAEVPLDCRHFSFAIALPVSKSASARRNDSFDERYSVNLVGIRDKYPLPDQYAILS